MWKLKNVEDFRPCPANEIRERVYENISCTDKSLCPEFIKKRVHILIIFSFMWYMRLIVLFIVIKRISRRIEASKKENSPFPFPILLVDVPPIRLNALKYTHRFFFCRVLLFSRLFVTRCLVGKCEVSHFARTCQRCYESNLAFFYSNFIRSCVREKFIMVVRIPFVRKTFVNCT